MQRTKSLAINRQIALTLTKFLILLGVATIVPFFGQQAITGPIVNAMLFISVMILGLRGGILVSLVPSIIALSVGLLPIILAPMIPFIMAGNIILVSTFNYFKKQNFWLGIVSASFLKFIFLFITSSIVINLFIKGEVAAKVAVTMSWPQLFTALAGGVVSYLFLKTIKRI